MVLALGNERIAIRRNGVDMTWWDENEMVVPQLRGESVILGNHQFAKAEPVLGNRTLIRSLT